MLLTSTANNNLKPLCREQLKEALHVLLTTKKPHWDFFLNLQSSQTYILKNALSQRKNVHSFIVPRQFAFATRLQNNLINMYDRCGSLVDALKVFDQITERDSFSWNKIIAAYRRHGYPHEAVTLFYQMQRTGFEPDQFTYAQMITACAEMGALQQGIDIHQSMKDRGISPNVMVATALVDMYAKSGSIDKACELFDKMPQRNEVSWNAMIAGFIQYGFVEKAFKTFEQMQLADVNPNSSTFVSMLSACAKMGALEYGTHIHQRIMVGGFLWDVVVASALVEMYVKCGRIAKARKVFDKIAQRNVISWTAMIVGYAQNGYDENALEIFKQMQLIGVKPNATTLASILPVCVKMGALEQGMDIHQKIMEEGYLSDVIVASALVDMYAKCGRIDKACQLFDKMAQRNVVSWTTMISGYEVNGFVDKALETFKQMHLAGVKPNSTTFASILPACVKMGAFEQGVEIHQTITEGGFLSNVIVVSALVDMYVKCGDTVKARKLFDRLPQRDAVSWTALIGGYVQNGFVEKALETFKQMQLVDVKPDSFTFASILPACAQIGALELGTAIHGIIIESGLSLDVVVASALVDMYAKCGSIDKAHELFDRMPQSDVVSWTAMIVGYVQNGFVEKALETFKQMRFAGVKPDSFTFASILSACARMGALKQGMGIHKSIMEGGFMSDAVVASALVDMYAKCGKIHKACELFDSIPHENVDLWNAIMAGYARNGFCKDALKCFESMKHSGILPDTVSFICVLFACSHAGLVNKGLTYFNHMDNHYCITPTVHHHVCMVDLLARAGYLENALKFIIKMPLKPVGVVWMCFLGACRSHMNIGLGVFTAMILLDLDPKNSATYVLLSNIYAEVGWWDEVQVVRREMKDRGIKKIIGCSWIEDHKMVHAFCAGDSSQP